MNSWKNNKGIIVGADRNIEWMLPWWWQYYARYNTFPVVFFDFGMSEEKRKWCQERGEVKDVEPFAVMGKNECSPITVRRWENMYSKVWEARKGWFQKPLAFLQAPFSVNLWLDLDCEVGGSLQTIFDAYDPSFDLAIAQEPQSEKWRWVIYNSGVVVFKKNAPFAELWIKECLRSHRRFISDQSVLSHLIRKQKAEAQVLPAVFNWLMYRGFNLSALVHHWSGIWGKEHIQKFGGVHALLGR